MLASVRLGEKSDAPCAVTTWRDHLYLAWTGTDMHINVASSVDGHEFTGKQRLAEVSYKYVTKSSPGTGMDRSSTMGTDINRSSTLGTGTNRSSTLGTGTNRWSTRERVALAPALTGARTRLCLAWTGGDRALNALASEPSGYLRPEASKVTFKERTEEPPSLTATGPGELAVAWRGTDRHVNLLLVAEDPSGTSLRTPGAKSRFDEATSDHAPALCSLQGRLVLAWTGSGRHINLASVR